MYGRLAVVCTLLAHVQAILAQERPPPAPAACSATLLDLLPTNTLNITRAALATSAAAGLVFPSPSVGFTLFAANNDAFASHGSGDVRAEAAQQILGNLSSGQLTAWIEYGLLPTAIRSADLLNMPSLPTELQTLTKNSTLGLQFQYISGSSTASEVQIADVLSNILAEPRVNITSSFQVCQSWVHVLDGVLWPSDSPQPESLPSVTPWTHLSGPPSAGIQSWQAAPPLLVPPGSPQLALRSPAEDQVPPSAGALVNGIIDTISSALDVANSSIMGAAPSVTAVPSLARVTPPFPSLSPPLPNPPPALTANAQPADAHSTTNTAAIIAGVAGGVALVVVAVGLSFIALHRRRNQASMRVALGSDQGSDVTPKGGSDKHLEIGSIGSSEDSSFMKAGDSALHAHSDLFQNASSEEFDVEDGLSRSYSLDAHAASEWEIRAEDITICRDPNGSGADWQLGSGGFGKVYRGVLEGSTTVAVKFVAGQSAKEQERFKREVAILKSLRHTNIVQFLGASVSATGEVMLVTEYLARGDLWRALSHDHQHLLSWYKRGRGIALDMLRGVAHMHSRKIAHLDLKSANILLSRYGTAKVADVGLAKILTRAHTNVSSSATFDWAAPEVLSGGECNEKADLWSLGVVLWEICTGERPHLRQLRPVRVPEECPASVAKVISDCLQMDPTTRPSAREVYDMLVLSKSSEEAPTAPPQRLPSLEDVAPLDTSSNPSSNSISPLLPGQVTYYSSGPRPPNYFGEAQGFHATASSPASDSLQDMSVTPSQLTQPSSTVRATDAPPSFGFLSPFAVSELQTKQEEQPQE